MLNYQKYAQERSEQNKQKTAALIRRAQRIMNYAHDIRRHAERIGISPEQLTAEAASFHEYPEAETDYYAVCEYIAAKPEYNRYF